MSPLLSIAYISLGYLSVYGVLYAVFLYKVRFQSDSHVTR